MKWMVFWAAAAALGQSAPVRLTLADALDLAGKQSPDVQLARLRALESRAQADAVRPALGPQVVASIAATYQTSNLQGIGLTFPGIPSRIGPYGVLDARPRVTQNILDLSLLADWRAARARVQAAEEDAHAIAERTRLAVVELYIRALAASSSERAAAARLATAEALLGQVRDAEQAGTANKLDVARAERQAERERTVMILAARDAGTLRAALKQTIGLEDAREIELAGIATPRAPQAGFETALERRPEMRMLAARRAALEQEYEKARRERWPKIAAFADYGALGRDPANAVSTWAIGASASVPLFTSGRIASEVKAARLRLEQWEQERKRVVLAIRQEIESSLVELDAARRARESAARARDAARETLELARLRYGAGLTTNLDVVAAQGSLAEAEEDEIRTRYDEALAAARLARACGDVRLILERP
jgi:outer membrane protein TolC